jgi:hypothetical protein
VLAAEVRPELAACVVELVARDDVGRAALVALRGIVRRCTGTVVDALLDPARDVVIRRRLPVVLLAGEPGLASWGLWRGLLDPAFEVRYRCGAALSGLAASGHLAVTVEDVLEKVRAELVADPVVWRDQAAGADLAVEAQDDHEPDWSTLKHAGSALEHVFTLLALALPAEPLRVALHALQADDSALRGTALEYLESILPADVRARLWPLLENGSASASGRDAGGVAHATPVDATTAPARGPRTQDELVAALSQAYPEIDESRRQKRRA